MDFIKSVLSTGAEQFAEMDRRIVELQSAPDYAEKKAQQVAERRERLEKVVTVATTEFNEIHSRLATGFSEMADDEATDLIAKLTELNNVIVNNGGTALNEDF